MKKDLDIRNWLSRDEVYALSSKKSAEIMRDLRLAQEHLEALVCIASNTIIHTWWFKALDLIPQMVVKGYDTPIAISLFLKKELGMILAEAMVVAKVLVCEVEAYKKSLQM